MSVGFIGKLSDDQHGNYIQSYLESVGVDTSYCVRDKHGHTSGLAFTEIKSPTESSILMYRDQVADLYLTPKEVSEEMIKQTNLLLISGTALAQSPSREAVFQALEYAKKNQVKVAFELDYRPYTWQTPEETAIYYNLVAQQATMIIGTREEFNVLENSQEENNQHTVQALFNYAPELIVIKHGVEGSYAYKKTGEKIKGYAYKAKVLKTFGVGDSYAAAFIYAIGKEKGLEVALKYASAAAAIVVSKHSSSEAMPTEEDITQLISHQKWGD